MREAEFKALPSVLKKRNWIILGFLLFGSLSLLSWRFTMGVLIGGILANLNFYSLHRTLVNVLIYSKEKGGVVSKFLLRMFITGLIIFIVLFKGWVNAFGLILGLSTVVINLFSLAFVEAKGIFLNRR